MLIFRYSAPEKLQLNDSYSSKYSHVRDDFNVTMNTGSAANRATASEAADSHDNKATTGFRSASTPSWSSTTPVHYFVLDQNAVAMESHSNA